MNQQIVIPCSLLRLFYPLASTSFKLYPDEVGCADASNTTQHHGVLTMLVFQVLDYMEKSISAIVDFYTFMAMLETAKVGCMFVIILATDLIKTLLQILLTICVCVCMTPLYCLPDGLDRI